MTITITVHGLVRRTPGLRYKLANRAKGACENCPSPRTPGSSRFCVYHLSKQRAYNTASYRRKV